MKTLFVILAVGLFNLISFSAHSQDGDTYYVVVGAFRKIENAVNYTKMANEKGFNAQYAINPARSLYYVYLLNTEDKRRSFAFLIKMRAETKFKDAWVFFGRLAQEEVSTPVVEEPVKEEPLKEEVKIEPVEELPKKDSIVEKKEEPVVKVEEKKPTGKPFFFKLLNSEGSEVQGEVHVQESSKATGFLVVKANEIAYLEAPKNKNGSYVIVTQAAGYKGTTLTFNYNNPQAEVGSQKESIIELSLAKAKKGDYIDFNNVKFFRNSVVLEPIAKNELDGLVDLLKENPKYKVKVHSFCNGNQKREIAVMGTSTNFFAIDPGNTLHSGSAKELTTLRAENIKSYLVSQGIDGKRITTKGEGGKIPLYAEGGSLGSYNDRIEVEITKN